MATLKFQKEKKEPPNVEKSLDSLISLAVAPQFIRL